MNTLLKTDISESCCARTIAAWGIAAHASRRRACQVVVAQDLKHVKLCVKTCNTKVGTTDRVHAQRELVLGAKVCESRHHTTGNQKRDVVPFLGILGGLNNLPE